MSVPESIAWLQVSRNSKSPSLAKIYATTILDELERLSEALDTCGRDLDSAEAELQEVREQHRAREAAFEELEQKTITAREEWDEVIVAAIPVVDELCAWVDTNNIGCIEVQQRGEELLQRLRRRAPQ
jgi:hypothetical protein